MTKLSKRDIYLVMQEYDDDGHQIVGAFTTQELADEFMKTHYHQRYQDEWDSMLGIPDPAAQGMKSPDEITVEEIDEYFEEFGHECWIEVKSLEGPIGDNYQQLVEEPKEDSDDA